MLGIEGQPARVPYSIACAPAESRRHDHLEFLVKLEPYGWPPHLADLRPGARVAVHGPFGSFVFPPRPEERHFLFVAGGTGIAPLRAMIVHAVRARLRGRLSLLYSARTTADFAYLHELRRYARAGRLRLTLTATREVPTRWRGGRGRVSGERLASLLETPETLCFVCGPASMVDEVPPLLLELGVDRTRIRMEEW